MRIQGKVLKSVNQVSRIILTIATMLILSSESIIAEDCGAPDSVILEIRFEGEITNPQRFEVDLFVFNDSNNLASISVNFAWDNPNIRIDSAKPTVMAEEAFNFNKGNPQFGPLFLWPEGANENLKFSFTGARLVGDGLALSPGRQLLGTCYFSILNWSASDCICFDTSTFGGNSGVIFVDGSNQAYEPIWSGPVCLFTGEDNDSDGVGNACQSCCIELSGNVDCDPNDMTDIADLVTLIDHLFIDLQPFCCQEEGNVDGDQAGVIDIGDLTTLIDHLFLSRTVLAGCR